MIKTTRFYSWIYRLKNSFQPLHIEYWMCVMYVLQTSENNHSWAIPSRKLTYPPKKWHFQDDFPFPKVGYVNPLEGMSFIPAIPNCLHFFSSRRCATKMCRFIGSLRALWCRWVLRGDWNWLLGDRLDRWVVSWRRKGIPAWFFKGDLLGMKKKITLLY